MSGARWRRDGTAISRARRERPDAVIVGSWSHSTPLWYAQSGLPSTPETGATTDVIDANLPNRPVDALRFDLVGIGTLERHRRPRE